MHFLHTLLLYLSLALTIPAQSHDGYATRWPKKEIKHLCPEKTGDNHLTWAAVSDEIWKNGTACGSVMFVICADYPESVCYDYGQVLIVGHRNPPNKAHFSLDSLSWAQLAWPFSPDLIYVRYTGSWV